MKKKLFALVTICLMVATVPCSIITHAESVPSAEATSAPRVEDIYEYVINDADRAEIKNFKPSDSYKGEVIIPDALDGHEVGYIDNAAFMNAKYVTSISIPATVTDMGNSVFFGCESLEKFTVREGNPYLSVTDGVLFADNNQMIVAYPANKAGDSYTVPNTVDEVAPGCFGFAKNLKTVTLSDKTAYIDKWAFGYSKLESINIPASVIQLDEYAFAYSESLHDVTLNAGLETIGDASFSVCSALTNITIPNTVTLVGQCAFAGTGMTSVTIPMSVSEIDYCAFGYDRDLKPISSFTIYGEEGSTAQSYCTEVDDENDYENHFTFVAMEHPDENADANPATDSNSDSNADVTSDTQADSDSDVDSEVVPETTFADAPAETTAETTLSDILAPEIKNNQFLQVVLATVGGIAVVLAIALAMLLSKKPNHSAKTKKDDDDDD